MQKRILLFSDTHEEASPDNFRAFLDKRFLGYLNSRVIRKKRYDRTYLKAAVEYALAARPDLVIFTGDATSCGQKNEFDRALEDFRVLLNSSLHFLYVPGNHDAYVKAPECRRALEEFTLAMNRNERSLSDYPFVLELDFLKAAVIHCARPVNAYLSCGIMEKKTLDFLRTQTEQKGEKALICAGHFPLLHGSSLWNFRRRLYGSCEAKEMVREGRIDLSLCGHIHHPLEQLDEQGRGEIVSGSLTRTGLVNEITFDSTLKRFSLKRIRLEKRS